MIALTVATSLGASAYAAAPSDASADARAHASTGGRAHASGGELAHASGGELPPELLGDPSLAEYLEYARRFSPKLKAAVARWNAASEQVARARALPDPVVSYGHFIEEVETRVGPQIHRFGVRQTIPWLGELGARGAVARAFAGAEAERVQAARSALELEISTAYHEYEYLARAIEITRARLDLLRRLEGAARTMYSAGTASYGDVMKAQIELARTENRLAGLEDSRGPLSARLAVTLDLPPDTVLPWPSPEHSPAHGRATPQREPPSLEGVLESLESSNPELRALDFETEAAGKRVDLARTGYLPDITIGLDYIVTDEAVMQVDESGKDPLVFTASIGLPLWFWNHGASVRAAESMQVATARARDQRANELASEAHMLLFGLRDAERAVSLHERELIPRAEQAFEATEAAYRGGSADFDSLIASLQMLLDLRLGLARAITDRAEAEAELGALVGGAVELERLELDTENAR